MFSGLGILCFTLLGGIVNLRLLKHKLKKGTNMLQAFDNMLMPTLYSQVGNAQVEEVRDDGLDFYVNVGEDYKVPYLEKLFDKQIKAEQILTHATDVANKLGLKNVETFKKFNEDCKKYAAKLFASIDLKAMIDASIFDEVGYAYDRLQFDTSAKNLVKDQKELCATNGYTTYLEVEAMFFTILVYLVKTFDEPELKSVDEIFGGGNTSAASGGSTSGGSEGTSTSAIATTTSSESGGSLVVSALVLGGLGLTAAYFYKKIYKS